MSQETATPKSNTTTATAPATPVTPPAAEAKATPATATPASVSTATPPPDAKPPAAAAKTGEPGEMKSLLADPNAKAGAAQNPEGTKPEETVPEKYEFKFPDGYTPDAKAVDAFVPVAKELGLTQAAAQRMIDFDVARDQAKAEQYRAFFAAETKACLAIPKFAEVQKDAVRAVDALIDCVPKGAERDQLTAMLKGNGSPLGVNPAFIKACAEFSKRYVREDVPLDGKAGGHRRETTLREKMYPTKQTQ